MAKRLGYTLLLTSLTASLLVVACSDDATTPNDGGQAGEAASGGPSEAGKSGSSTAGSASGGQGGSSGSSGNAGEGQAGEPALGGAPTDGGAATGGAPVADGGAGGSPEVIFTCGTTTIVHELCSASMSMSCADQADCAECVLDRTGERETFAECAACLAVFDEGFQCGIDAFEAGKPSEAFECVPDYGADLNLDCYAVQEPAYDCLNYIAENPCPEKWPLD